MTSNSELLGGFGISEGDLPDQRGVRSVPFEAHLILPDQVRPAEVDKVVENLANTWHSSYLRKPSKAKVERFKQCALLILLNLVQAEVRSSGLTVGIATGKQRLDDQRRYQPDFMSVDYFLKAMEALQEDGTMLQVAPGYQNDGLAQVARYSLTDAARAAIISDAPPLKAFTLSGTEETIRLKDHHGQLAKYKDTDETKAMRAGLARINDLIATARVSSRRPPLPELDLEDGHSSHGVRLYRVFNNGTFAEGGRFYGGWWQSARKHFRPLITISDETTIEADFKGLHPTILFAQSGLPCPEDPYSLVPGAANDSLLRDHAKTTFLALLNAGRKGTQEPRDFDTERHGMSRIAFQEQVKAAFPLLSDHFGTGVGTRLQRLDSDLAEMIMLHFVERNVPVLPVHDSFIVAERHREELVQVMVQTFRFVYGQEIGVSLKGSRQS
ncbi:MAG: hypothetical protein U1E69_09125 [Tabrizicola sp.]|uniref:hypothetical protein n=1 Tax=Tabrizicola sp. TaxID=2005166 RepID=UPI002AB86F68|nr:hypothetical protein [Tabrizicola sp.]MDZ4086952.1 hypothetical protein [Tabrizicola sp.]